MLNDDWIDRLICLQRSQVHDWKAFTKLEIQRRLELDRRYKQAVTHCTNQLELAQIATRQLRAIKALNQARERRRRALRKRHAEQLYSLLQSKNQHPSAAEPVR